MARSTPLEKSIERCVVDYAKKRLGLLVYKMNGFGARAWPDRMFLYKGHLLFIEFKRHGLKPTPLQAQLHMELRRAGFEVAVIDDAPVGKLLLVAWIEACNKAEEKGGLHALSLLDSGHAG